MSEYVTVEANSTSDPDMLEIVTNQTLTEHESEIYESYEAGDEGSPIAQMLFNGVNNLMSLTIQRHTLMIRRAPDALWEDIIDDIRDALRDFFL